MLNRPTFGGHITPPQLRTKKCLFHRKTAYHSQLCTKKCHFRRKTPPPGTISAPKNAISVAKPRLRLNFAPKSTRIVAKLPPDTLTASKNAFFIAKPHHEPNSAPKSAFFIAKPPPTHNSAPKNAISVEEPRHPAPFLHQKRPATFAHFIFFVYLYIGLNLKLT